MYFNVTKELYVWEVQRTGKIYHWIFFKWIKFTKLDVLKLPSPFLSVKVYSWGSSQYGQLGLGPGRTGQTPVPCLVMGLAGEQIVAISAGQYHSLSLTEDGR